MSAEAIRSAQDKHLFDQLLEDVDVKRVNDAIAKREEEGVMGTRRRLLSTSVRLSRTMAPSIHTMTQECADSLGVTIPVELYVYNSPQFNAACVKPEEGRLFIMFSSSLLEGFSETELRFVMGHELGHYIYQHHDIPIGYLMRGQSRPSPDLALTLTSWSRYAEFSADRAGAYCTNDFSAVASSLFKLASGLTGSLIHFDVDDFLKQVDEMKLEDADAGSSSSAQDWFMTHPFSPLRVKALQLFHRSELIKNPAGDAPLSQRDLEVGVESLMSLMEPSYLEARTDTANYMSRLLFAGSLVIANANGHIDQEEIELFEKFFGKRKYSEELNLEKLEKELPERAQKVRDNASVPKRIQVLRDLCLMAQADGKIQSQQRQVMDRIAEMLGVPGICIEQSLGGSVELD